MTTQEINSKRNENGVFSASNEVSNWFAVSRNGINMIEINEVIIFYNEKAFAKRLTQLINQGI